MTFVLQGQRKAQVVIGGEAIFEESKQGTHLFILCPWLYTYARLWKKNIFWTITITIIIVTWSTLIYKIKSSSSVLNSQQSLGSDVKGVVIKCDFNSRLNSSESAVLRIVAGNAFHATGPETENAHW